MRSSACVGNMLRVSALAALSALGGCGTGNAVIRGQSPPPEEPPAAARSSYRYDAVPLIARQVLFGNPSKVAPALSPRGDQLAYLAPDEGVLNVFVKSTGKDDDRVVTADRLRGIRQYQWAENGKQLIYLQDQGGDENWHIYVVAVAGGEAARDLTPFPKVQAQILGAEPDFPDELLIGLNDRDPQHHDVYRVNLQTGKRRLIFKNEIGAVGFVADHRLQLRVLQILEPDGGAKLLYRRGGSGDFRELTSWGAEDMFTTGPVGFAGDDQTLYLLSSVGSNTVELRALDLRTGQQRTLASDAEADVTELHINPRSNNVEAVGITRARLEWKVLDPRVEADFAAVAKLGDGDRAIVSQDNRARTWLVRVDDDNGPPHYYTYDRQGQQGTFLFSSRPELDKAELAEMRPVSYQARDGLTIHGYLTLPPKVRAEKLPLVVHPHGGPWYRDTWGFDPTAQWLANRGYAVLQPNFRGSTGYGKKFLNAADREWGGKMQADITDGTRWLIAQGIADASHVCIMGGSYGGYATLMGLASEPDLYACGVDIVGVANLITWLNTIPPYWIPFRHVLHQRVGHPERDEAFLKARSPVFLADKIRAPLLIAQGANDPRVPRAESTQIRDAIQKAGRTVEYVEFHDEGHGFARPENRLRFYGLAEVFLNRYLGGRAEPDPASVTPPPTVGLAPAPQ